MSFRTIVISKRSKLEFKANYLVIRNEEVLKIFLDEIDCVIIESTASAITTSLISELSKRKIKVIFCDEKHNPECELLPYYNAFDTSQKIKFQVGWGKHLKQLVWTKIVEMKIRKQKEHLLSLGFPEWEKLQDYENNLQLNDKTNREGHSAKVYFNALFGKGFTRGSEVVQNAYLNYGYAILLSRFNREIVASGYITQIGLFHCNEFNQFNFACDLMEPFRIMIDKMAVLCTSDVFGAVEKKDVIKVFEQEVIIDNKKCYVSNAIKIYCNSIFDALNSGDINNIKEYKDGV